MSYMVNDMNIKIAVIMVAVSAPVSADQYLYPTIPGTSVRDFSAPGYIIQETPESRMSRENAAMDGYLGFESTPSTPQYNIYRTIPGTNIRDLSAPGFISQ